jgi:nitrogenase delta subunit
VKAMGEIEMKDRVAQLADYIMKKCLWQFHSRTWDRLRQNENILSMTSQILLEEPIETATPEAKCYWVDAVSLVDAYRAKFAWLSQMSKEEIKQIMDHLKERIDFLTVKGSLNEELNDSHY